jgi:hypothetical protein
MVGFAELTVPITSEYGAGIGFISLESLTYINKIAFSKLASFYFETS